MKSNLVSTLIVGFAILVAGVIMAVPQTLGIDPVAARAGALILVAVVLWATAYVPEYLTAIGFFLIAMVASLAPAEVVFAGFHSSAVWLIFGGMILGLAVNETGLGARAARAMFASVPASYTGLVTLVAGIGLALAFIVPSAMGRVMLLTPVVLAAADGFGYQPGSRGRAGMVMAAAAGTVIPAFAILPSNVPNVVLLGIAENLYGVALHYGSYLVLNFTLMGIFSFVVPVALIAMLFRDQVPASGGDATAEPWTGREKRLVAIIAGTLLLWTTDTVHGVSPAWVSLGAAVICLLPRFGVVESAALTGRVNFGPWFFVAGVIGVGALARHSNVADLVAGHLIAISGMAPGADFHNYAAMSGIGIVMSLLTTHPAVPAIMTPLAENLAQVSGWPVASVLMAQVPSWMVVLFPYQMPPLLVAVTLAGIPVRRVLPMTAAYFVLAIVVMLPLQYLWGRWLGIFP